MEGRLRRYGNQTSPERTKVWVEPPPKHHHQLQHQPQQQQQQQGRKIPVVYYLCRNRHLEHPHFVEVPVSSPEGLYLRDVINRLNSLRGKRMASMYSWSCKRSYKNGFVWHDLSEDDLVLPAQGNEYVLKGSELLDHSPPDRHHRGIGDPKVQNQKHPQQESPTSYRTHEASSSSSSPPTVVKEAKLSQSPPPPRLPPHLQEGELSPARPGSSGNLSPDHGGRITPLSEMGSPSLAEYRVYKPIGAQDASTQTDENGGRKTHGPNTRIAGVSTDDVSFGAELDGIGGHHHNRSPRSKERLEIGRDEISPPLTSSTASSLGGKMDTLENLIRAEAASRMKKFRIIEDEEVLAPMRAKLKATNLLMQLISCGSISVKGHHHNFGFVPTYRPRFTQANFTLPMFSNPMVLGDLDCRSDNSRAMGLLQEEREYFGGSLIEAKKHKEEVGASSSDEDRSWETPDSKRDKENLADSKVSKCLPRTIKITSCKQSRNETMASPMSDASNSSAGPDCGKSSPLNSSKGESRRITDASSAKGSSTRLETFKEEKEKVIKIEES
ncbi:protein UPSTREAM OF FLC [Cocos nucifera]|uniref:Protein UPSTREAM OF FLC n=1 Tax=Cocos nucifera TaxID=13894 RepID=A0A8K0IL30_COCNU|nr:protein UPSTREAM OF FLC [Cocos nucifera]